METEGNSAHEVAAGQRRSSYSFEHCTITEFLSQKLSALESAEEEVEERGENLDGWGILPDIILEKVFSYLSIRDRYSASSVCRQWQQGFYMQATWNTFELQDDTLTRHKFNYHMGWQLILDHLRVQFCLFRIGTFIRNLVLSPMSNLYNLYEFMNMISFYSEKYKEDKRQRAPLHIKSLRFIFQCNMTATKEQSIYGTGGKLLEALQRLMGNLDELRNLELIDLLLDSCQEAVHLLDDVCAALCDRLERLVLINVTKNHFDLLHPACFINLRILKVSPQNLGTETVEMLCENLRLRELHLIQNGYTERTRPVDRHAWLRAKFRVYFWVQGKTDKEILWQEQAPAASVIYDCPKTQVTWNAILTVIDLYSNKLEVYGHLGLPRFGRSRSFDTRPDSMLLTLCRKCPYLTTLFIRERISTSTTLLLVSMAPNLRYLHIRRNALILKCDYKSHNLELDSNFIRWLSINSRSFEKMTNAISQHFQYDWKPLTDVQFKEVCRQKQAY